MRHPLVPILLPLLLNTVISGKAVAGRPQRPTPTPTSTPAPTATRVPTSTPTPTAGPVPTATPTIVQRPTPTVAPPPAEASVPVGYALTWADEFDNFVINRKGNKNFVATSWSGPTNIGYPAFDSPDATWMSGFPWGIQYDPPANANYARTQDGNREEQWYVEHPYFGEQSQNLLVPQNFNPYSQPSPGVLRITAKQATTTEQAYNNIISKTSRVPGADGRLRYKYLSGHMTTVFTKRVRRGFITARVKLSDMPQGTWPAMWTTTTGSFPTPENPGGATLPHEEIDLFEILADDPNQFPQSVHKNGSNLHYSVQVPMPMADRTQWHVFSVLITDNEIDWFVDGVKTGAVTDPAYIPQYYQMIMFDIALGTTVWGTMGHSPPPNMPPVFMDIDWVRVYEKL